MGWNCNASPSSQMRLWGLLATTDSVTKMIKLGSEDKLARCGGKAGVMLLCFFFLALITSWIPEMLWKSDDRGNRIASHKHRWWFSVCHSYKCDWIKQKQSHSVRTLTTLITSYLSRGGLKLKPRRVRTSKSCIAWALIFRCITGQ